MRSAVDTLRLTVDGDPASSERFIDIIDRNAQRLGALVEDLLDLSRIESKDYRPEAKPLEARQPVDEDKVQVRLEKAMRFTDPAHMTRDLPASAPLGSRRTCQGSRTSAPIRGDCSRSCSRT